MENDKKKSPRPMKDNIKLKEVLYKKYPKSCSYLDWYYSEYCEHVHMKGCEFSDGDFDDVPYIFQVGIATKFIYETDLMDEDYIDILQSKENFIEYLDKKFKLLERTIKSSRLNNWFEFANYFNTRF